MSDKVMHKILEQQRLGALTVDEEFLVKLITNRNRVIKTLQTEIDRLNDLIGDKPDHYSGNELAAYQAGHICGYVEGHDNSLIEHEAETTAMREAMDALLISHIGVVPEAATQFYDPFSQTFKLPF